MARLARVEAAGFPHHVLQRGNNRQAVFVDAVDHERYLALLQEGLFVAPRLMFCISTPMSEATLDEIDARFERALKRLDDVR